MRFFIESRSRNHINTFSNHECWIKPNTKLSYKVMITSFLSFLEFFHELLCSRFCNRPDVFMNLFLCHTDTIIRDSESFSLFIYFYFDLKVCIITKKVCISQSLKSRFINCVTRIRDKFSQEYFFVWINRVRQQFQNPPRFCLKVMLFRHSKII